MGHDALSLPWPFPLVYTFPPTPFDSPNSSEGGRPRDPHTSLVAKETLVPAFEGALDSGTLASSAGQGPVAAAGSLSSRSSTIEIDSLQLERQGLQEFEFSSAVVETLLKATKHSTKHTYH